MFLIFFQTIFKKITSWCEAEQTSLSRAGFTMIELLIVIVIFSIVIGISAEIFSSTFAAQKQARQLQGVLDNARYALERIAKSTRVSCVLPSSSSSSLAMYHFRRKEKLVYELDSNNNLVETETDSGIQANLIGENMDIERLKFTLRGLGRGDGQQPRVGISLRIKPKLPKYKEESINLQTSISPRFLEKYFASSSICVP